jgi:hypothetical protein
MPISKNGRISTKEYLEKGRNVPSQFKKRKGEQPRKNQKEIEEIYNNFPHKKTR